MSKANKDNLDWFNLAISAFATNIASHDVSNYSVWAKELREAIIAANDNLMSVANTYGNNSVPSLAGFYAEAFHVGSFNINSAKNNSSYLATLENSNELASVDISTNWGDDYSLKYYKNAKQSLDKQAETLEGPGFPDSKYVGQKRLIPSDQLEEAKNEATKKIAKEVNRPDVAKRYQETKDNLTDRIQSPDGVKSDLLTKGEADEWARNAKKKVIGFFPDKPVNLMNHVKEIGKAAGSAALISMTIQTAPILIKDIVRLCSDTNYQLKDFGTDIITFLKEDGVLIGVDTFIKAGVAGSLTGLIKSGTLAGPFSSLSPTGVAALSVTSVETSKALWKWYKGELTGEQAVSEGFKAGLKTCASLKGAMIGQATIPIPLVGSIVGGMLASYLADKSINLVENSLTVKMLDVIDETFYLHKEVLATLFSINVDYQKLLLSYEGLILSNNLLIADREFMLESLQLEQLSKESLEQSTLALIKRLKDPKGITDKRLC